MALLRVVSFLLAESTGWFLRDRQVHFCRFLVHFMKVLLVEGAVVLLMSVLFTELTVADILGWLGFILLVGMNRTVADVASCPMDKSVSGLRHFESCVNSVVFLLFW